VHKVSKALKDLLVGEVLRVHRVCKELKVFKALKV
jgi:hypothetical protein